MIGYSYCETNPSLVIRIFLRAAPLLPRLVKGFPLTSSSTTPALPTESSNFCLAYQVSLRPFSRALWNTSFPSALRVIQQLSLVCTVNLTPEEASFFAAGWHPDSALPGESGNTVINGHHNIDGEVFADLVNVVEGDTILIHSGERSFEYVVTNRMILPETFMDAATRLDNARWLGRSDDVRLTLVTCWPLESYTHRLILVAVPVE